MTRDICSQVEASPLSPLQGDVKSTSSGHYGIFHPFVECRLLRSICLVVLRRCIDVTLRRICDVAATKIR